GPAKVRPAEGAGSDDAGSKMPRARGRHAGARVRAGAIAPWWGCRNATSYAPYRRQPRRWMALISLEKEGIRRRRWCGRGTAVGNFSGRLAQASRVISPRPERMLAQVSPAVLTPLASLRLPGLR